MTIMPLTPGPQVDAFVQAQKSVLDRLGVQAVSRYEHLHTPAMKTHLLEAGQGSPVLLIHGGGAVAVELAPLLQTLQPHFHLFAPDRPGCGLTDKIDYRGVPYRQHAIDFIDSLLDALELPAATLIGNSIGGYWALLFALAKPERVTKLVLAGAPAGSSPPAPPAAPSAAATPPPTVPPPVPPSLDQIRARYAGGLVAQIDCIPMEMLQASLAACHLPGAALGWESMVAQIRHERSGLTFALRSDLPELQTETLFVWGDQERSGLPSQGYEMAALAPNAHCEVVHNAGHLPFWDQPERCGQLIRAFLNPLLNDSAGPDRV